MQEAPKLEAEDLVEVTHRPSLKCQLKDLGIKTPRYFNRFLETVDPKKQIDVSINKSFNKVNVFIAAIALKLRKVWSDRLHISVMIKHIFSEPIEVD